MSPPRSTSQARSYGDNLLHPAQGFDAKRPNATPDTGIAQGWPLAMVALALVWGALGALYRHTISDLLAIWNQLTYGNYAHGYLVVLIALYLVWRERPVLARQVPTPQPWALVLVVGASLVWMLGELADVQMVQMGALVPLLGGAVWAVLGDRVTRRLVFPLAFLLFAVPIWSPLTPGLQDLTTGIVYGAARALGIPAFLDGHGIVLPAGRLNIEGACSGLSYLLAALTLGALYAHMNYRRLTARAMVIAAAAGAALVANWLRVLIVVYLGYTTEMRHPWVYDHLNLGWALFGLMVFGLLGIDLVVHRLRGAGPDEPPAAPEADTTPERGLPLALAAMAAVAALALGPTLAHLAVRGDAGPVVLRVPPGAGGWQGPLSGADDWAPRYPGAVPLYAAYRKGAHTVHLYIGYYTRQGQGAELINDLNSIAGAPPWRRAHDRDRVVQTGTDAVLENEIRTQAGRARVLWYWYRVAGRQTTSGYRAKLLQIWGLVTGRRGAAVIALAIEPADASARAGLDDFRQAMAPALDRTLAPIDAR